ncbi:hypothetical protein BH20ACI2_BH20ACI2_26430 [soil metagenome]
MMCFMVDEPLKDLAQTVLTIIGQVRPWIKFLKVSV